MFDLQALDTLAILLSDMPSSIVPSARRQQGSDWDHVDSEIKDWLKKESEGRFTYLGDSTLEGFQLAFELGKLVGTRWVNETNETYVIGGFFTSEKEALKYVEGIRREVTSIEGRAVDVERPLLPSGPNKEQQK